MARDESMDPDLAIPSRIQDPSLKPLQPLYVDSWASLHVSIIGKIGRGSWYLDHAGSISVRACRGPT